jgi:hypothetical protein
MSFRSPLDMMNHHLGIASDFQVFSSHLSGYCKPSMNSLIFGFVVCGDEVELDCVLNFFSFWAGK